MAYLYFAPFKDAPITISDEQFRDILARSTQPTTKSLDHVDLRKREVSDKLGFIKLTTDETDVVDEDLLKELARSEVRGMRGERAVIVTENYEDSWDELEVWVGRNVWFNPHRMTAGYPASASDEQDMLDDIENRTDVVFEVQEEDDTCYDGVKQRLVAALSAINRWDRVTPTARISVKQEVEDALDELSEEINALV